MLREFPAAMLETSLPINRLRTSAIRLFPAAWSALYAEAGFGRASPTA